MKAAYMFTVAEASLRIRRRELSPIELIDSVLGRIDRLEPILEAWVTLDREGAIATAQQLAKEAEQGKLRGPLHGIPVGIKDIFYTTGMKTAAGSKLYAEFIPSYDATSVTRLKEAGAIILGKTTTTEFALFDPTATKNPWNPNHSPGGSSSGSAAAVSSGMCPAALGTQTAGSTLRPATFCGIVGLKPTIGRISRYGVIPLSWCLDHVGVFVRTVEDAALLLEVLAGYDPYDASSSVHPVPCYRKALEKIEIPRIGIVREFFSNRSEDEVRVNTEVTIQKLSLAGAQVEEIRLPESFQAVHASHSTIMRVEAAAYHEEMFQNRSGDYRPKIRSFISTGLLIPGTVYVKAHRIRNQFCREMKMILSRVDCLLTPAVPSPAPEGLESTGDPSFNIPWTFCGFPSISLPSGLSKGELPLGIQLVGRPFDEESLLGVARWCERVIGFGHTPHE